MTATLRPWHAAYLVAILVSALATSGAPWPLWLGLAVASPPLLQAWDTRVTPPVAGTKDAP